MEYLLIPMRNLRSVSMEVSWASLPVVEIETLSQGIGIMDIIDADITPFDVGAPALPERRCELHE